MAITTVALDEPPEVDKQSGDDRLESSQKGIPAMADIRQSQFMWRQFNWCQFMWRFSSLGALVLALVAGQACSPKYPKCKQDKDCKESEFCVNGLCQQCRDDADCGNGKRCSAGVCEPAAGYCVSDADCPSGQRCENNLCVGPAKAAPAADNKPADTGAECDMTAVYFEFDSDSLTAPSRNALEATAQCLQKRSLGKVRVTGHCDPRGTEEYNLALGERRARAVQQYLKSLGVEEKKVSVTSVGEELASQNEAEWPKDRKAEFASE